MNGGMNERQAIFYWFLYEGSMDDNLKKAIKVMLLLGALGLAAFGIYKLYFIVIEDATGRIKQGVTEGVTKGVGGSMNPLKWFGK